MSYPLVPLRHSSIHTNGLSEDLSNAVLRNQELLTQILAGTDDEGMTLKELCALVQNLCSAGMCTEEQWQAVQDVMDIPHRRPDDVPWRKWIKQWCGLVVDPLKALRYLITDSWDGPADWQKMQWIYDFCHPMADAAAYRTTFDRMLILALDADYDWNPRIRYDRISLPLIGLLERHSPPGMDDYKWVRFFTTLASIAAETDREQCVQICDFIMNSNTFASFFADLDYRDAWPPSKLLALSKLAQCSARHFQSAVFDFVLRIHRLLVPEGLLVPFSAADSQSIWTGAIMHAAGYGNLDAYKWLWEHLNDENFGLKHTFENVLQQAMQSGNADLVEFMLSTMRPGVLQQAMQSGNADLVEFMLTNVWSGAARDAALRRAWTFSRRYPMDYPDEVKARLEEMATKAGMVDDAAEA